MYDRCGSSQLKPTCHGLPLTLAVYKWNQMDPYGSNLYNVRVTDLYGSDQTPPENLGQDLEDICRIVLRTKWVNQVSSLSLSDLPTLCY